MTLIDADELKNQFADVLFCDNTHIMQVINSAPTIEAEPIRHGRWIPSDKGDGIYTCSECGFVRDAYILEENAYCPNCGTDMRGR